LTVECFVLFLLVTLSNYYYVTLYNQSVTVHLTSGAGTAYPSEESRNCLPFWREQDCFKWGSCYSIWNFLSSILSNIVCFFILFLLVIVSSILLRIMACDYIL